MRAGAPPRPGAPYRARAATARLPPPRRAPGGALWLLGAALCYPRSWSARAHAARRDSGRAEQPYQARGNDRREGGE